MIGLRRWWHRLFGHPQLILVGTRKHEAGLETHAFVLNDPQGFDGLTYIFRCLSCTGWVELIGVAPRQIKIVEREAP